VIGALLVAVLAVSRPPITLVAGSAIAAAVLLLALSFVRHFGLAAAVLMAMGFAQIVFMTSCNTTVQITVPDELRGRIMGLYALVFAGMTPIGSLLMGGIAERWGVGTACMVGGAMGTLLVSALTFAWRRRRERAGPTPPGPDAPAVP
jgi:predicted MFS family arabinose efflux permease